MSPHSTEWHVAQGVQFLPAPDALWRQATAPLVARYNVLGAPLEIATNAPLLATLAEEVFGDWGAPDSGTTDVKRMRVFLHDVPESPSEETPPTLCVRMQDSYLLLSAGSSLGFADGRAGCASAFVTPTLLMQRSLVKTAFVESLGMYLVSRERPATLHCAAVIHQGRCALLAGPSGIGKSTLAYACLREGFGLLAEDTVFAEAQADPVIAWGCPWTLHLLPDAVRFFPELAGAETIRQMNGETKRRIVVNSFRPGAAIPHREVWGLCSLGRTRGAETRLTSADPTRLRRALTEFKGDPPLDRAAMNAVVDRLLTRPSAHLEVGSDLQTAVRVLRRWMEAE